MYESFAEWQAAQAGTAAESGNGVREELCALYAVLGPFLSAYTTDTGVHAAKNGSVLLFFEGGRLKCCLMDKYRQTKCFLTLDSLSDPLGDIEVTMKRGEMEWTRDPKRS